MNDFALTTPVVFIIFNRPDTTEKVFERIRKAKPTKFLVIADGPRKDREHEAENCAQTRAIIEKVDWNCEILKNYSDSNMGCKRRVSSGLDWVFTVVEEAIILEDDCLPDITFFRFCQELLERYRHDERIMQISGTNFISKYTKQILLEDYYFSDFGSIWGWASWRRAWKLYDVNMILWKEFRESTFIKDYLLYDKKQCTKTKTKEWEQVSTGEIDTWDFQWGFAKKINSGLSIVPKANLISNIGFDSRATHTQGKSIVSDLAYEKVEFPLEDPSYVLRHRQFDKEFQNEFYRKTNILTSSIKKILFGK